MKLRKAGIALLLIGATLLIAGCNWATVYYSEAGGKHITLTQDFTRRLIWNCTAQAGAGSARAFCVFDRIEGVCHTFPNAYIYQDDCYLLTDYGDWPDMEEAIKMVIGWGGRGCLSYWVNPPPCIADCYPNAPPPTWRRAPTGSFGCA
jgi:hypothetical protein